jgi:multidrug efflux pump subunit AcrA (membrane-fusion protein)
MNPEAPGANGRLRPILFGGAVMAVIALAAYYTLRAPAPAPAETAGPKAPDGTVALSEAAAREAGLVVEAAKTVTRREQLEAPGVLALDERRTARIGSPVDGKVIEVFVEIGDRVAQGTDLAHMIGPVVHDAWAAYRKAVAERRRTENDLKFAVQADERARRLFADKAISEQEVQRAASNRVAAEEALNIVETEVRRSEEELEHLGITNSEDPSGETGEQIPVKAPLTGVVLEKLITEGTAVTPGTPLFVVSDLASLWAMAEIDETAISHVKAGVPVGVSVSAYPGETFTGTIAWVADMVNPKTRRVTVRCALPNAQGRLKPEMYATVMLGEGEPRPVVVVPSAAVQDIDGKPVVFVEDGTGRYRRRDVTVGPDRDGTVEVRSGLRDGERIVVAGAFLLKSELLKSTTPEG